MQERTAGRQKELTNAKQDASKSTFLTTENLQGTYLVYPRFLLGMELNEVTKLIYILLLDRGRLSTMTGQLVDENGYAYVFYDIPSLAQDSGKSISTVKAALRDLEKADLILRRKQATDKHRRIYVKIRTDFCPPQRTEFRPHKGQKTDPNRDRKLTPTGTESCPYTLYKTNINKININKTNRFNDYSFSEGESL
ncbi:MAG: replication initiator protein A [Oscillospiraceae bacterium]|nr:replication initiator protein A [Oscillospiraceae bacterium]